MPFPVPFFSWRISAPPPSRRPMQSNNRPILPSQHIRHMAYACVFRTFCGMPIEHTCVRARSPRSTRRMKCLAAPRHIVCACIPSNMNIAHNVMPKSISYRHSAFMYTFRHSIIVAFTRNREDSASHAQASGCVGGFLLHIHSHGSVAHSVPYTTFEWRFQFEFTKKRGSANGMICSVHALYGRCAPVQKYSILRDPSDATVQKVYMAINGQCFTYKYSKHSSGSTISSKQTKAYILNNNGNASILHLDAIKLSDEQAHIISARMHRFAISMQCIPLKRH